MNFYIAAHDQDAANELASELLSRWGHNTTSRWLSKPFGPTAGHSPDECHQIAQDDHDDIAAADALVVIASPHRVPGGKFVEVGIALGLGKKVYLVGRRENMLMWLPAIKQFDSADLFIEGLHG
jgi:nucleoside 2-deoxyribosyltransferase